MECGELIFTGHALRRMQERGFRAAQIREVIESNPADSPYPSYLLLGLLGDEPLHLVVAVDAENG
ncbi:MAG: DUF4258 domain-containing protein [Candidatus Binataceae bacterium]